jgi:hypothetical protein
MKTTLAITLLLLCGCIISPTPYSQGPYTEPVTTCPVSTPLICYGSNGSPDGLCCPVGYPYSCGVQCYTNPNSEDCWGYDVCD